MSGKKARTLTADELFDAHDAAEEACDAVDEVKLPDVSDYTGKRKWLAELRRITKKFNRAYADLHDAKEELRDLAGDIEEEELR